LLRLSIAAQETAPGGWLWRNDIAFETHFKAGSRWWVEFVNEEGNLPSANCRRIESRRRSTTFSLMARETRTTHDSAPGSIARRLGFGPSALQNSILALNLHTVDTI